MLCHKYNVLFQNGGTELVTAIEYKNYRTDELAKTTQYLWDAKKITFPKGFKYTPMEEFFFQNINSYSNENC